MSPRGLGRQLRRTCSRNDVPTYVSCQLLSQFRKFAIWGGSSCAYVAAGIELLQLGAIPSWAEAEGIRTPDSGLRTRVRVWLATFRPADSRTRLAAAALKSVSSRNGSTALNGNRRVDSTRFCAPPGPHLATFSTWLLFFLLFLGTLPQPAIFDQVHFC